MISAGRRRIVIDERDARRVRLPPRKKVRIRRRAAEFRLRPSPVRHLRADGGIAADVGRCTRGARRIVRAVRREHGRSRRWKYAAYRRLELRDRRDGAERAERLVAREADHDRHVAVLLRLERLLRADHVAAVDDDRCTHRAPRRSDRRRCRANPRWSSRPTPAASASPAPSPCSSATARIGSPNGLPLMPTTFVNRPRAAGLACSNATAVDPADWPTIVTLAGSPPNAAMLRCTHCRPATRSMSP